MQQAIEHIQNLHGELGVKMLKETLTHFNVDEMEAQITAELIDWRLTRQPTTEQAEHQSHLWDYINCQIMSSELFNDIDNYILGRKESINKMI